MGKTEIGAAALVVCALLACKKHQSQGVPDAASAVPELVASVADPAPETAAEIPAAP